MLPAAIWCRCGFQKCVRARSISVTSTRSPPPYLSPSFVASSRPPAPPPTMTTRRVNANGRRDAERASTYAQASFLALRWQVGAHAFVDFGGHADRFRQRRMRVDRLPDVDRVGAHF